MKKYILAFETTGENASVACIDEEGNAALKKTDGLQSHLQSLMPMTESLMEENGIEVSDIICVAASAGPGSFTGVRIGVATARSFAQAAGIKCISVPTLPAFAYNIDAKEYGGLICPVLDARREQVYGGAFFFDGDIVEAVAGGAYSLVEYLELLGMKAADLKIPNIMFFGDGAEKYRDEINIWRDANSAGELQLNAEFAEGGVGKQTAVSVAKLALKLYNEGKQVDFNAFTPVYMRKAEAERMLEAAAGAFFVRPAVKDDVVQISGLENICFSLPWSERSFFEEITDNEIARYAVAEAAGKIVGYAGVWLVAGEGHITNIAVHPEFRRRGVAKELILNLIEISEREGVKAFTLEARASNAEAISLYKSLEFSECGVRRKYYEDDNEDAVIMWKR